METIKQKRIQPLFSRSITIQNLPKYQDFIKKRYKTTLNFKFACPEKKPTALAKILNKNPQNKLFKALKSLKVFKDADLREFNVEIFHIFAHKTLAIYKRLSKIKSISVRILRKAGSVFYTNFKEKWLRYMPALRYLDYELAKYTKKGTRSTYDTKEAQRAKEVQHPLRDIKYCPKIQSLRVKVPDFATPFFKSLYNFKQYPLTITCLSISPEYKLTEDPNSSIDCLKNLRSVQLKFDQASCPDSTIRNLNALCHLLNLQELDLQFKQTVLPEVETAMWGIFGKGNLEKLKLSFETNYQFAGALEALENCQLTDFSLEGPIFEEKMVAQIAKFLQGQTRLQSLDLHLTNEDFFSSQNIFKDVCKEVNNLPALKNLSLNFHATANIFKKIPLGMTLSPLLMPTITLSSFLMPTLSKLESLSLKCNQVNPSEEFSSLVSGLKGSAGSIQKLKIDLMAYYPTKQACDNILPFVKSLENIRQLKLYNLDISSEKLLHDFAEAVSKFKSLRTLVIGNIQGTISMPTFLNIVENISKKRGLVKFKCSTATGVSLMTGQTAPKISLKKVQKINPALEIYPSMHYLFDEDRFNSIW